MTKHRRMMAAIALATLAAVALTGCLVTQKPPEPPYYRESDNLRIYKQGDYIRYNVFATTVAGPGTGDFRSGVLEVEWGNYANLISPDSNASNDGAPYEVIEKRYLYCLDGAYCDPEPVVVQYIHQDDSGTATEGTERLVAMGNQAASNQYYWLNTTGGSDFPPANPDNTVTGGQEPVITLKSPLYINDAYTVEYYLMDGCISGVASCGSDVGRFTNSISVVGDGNQVNTNIGNYANPFQIIFEGETFPDAEIGDQLPLTLDVFDLCTHRHSRHKGHLYIVPEIGVIEMQITCTDTISGEATLYDITVDSISSSILAGS